MISQRVFRALMTKNPQQVRHSSSLPIGKRQMEQMRNWTVSGMAFGASGFLGLLYFTDWRVFTDYIPFYNGKYVEIDEAAAEENKK